MPGPWTFNILHIGEGLNLGYPTLIWHISHSFTTVPPLLRAVAILSVTGNPPDIPLCIFPQTIFCVLIRDVPEHLLLKLKPPSPFNAAWPCSVQILKGHALFHIPIKNNGMQIRKNLLPRNLPRGPVPMNRVPPCSPPLCHSLWQPSKLVAITTGCGHQLHTLFTIQGFQSSKVPTTVV